MYQRDSRKSSTERARCCSFRFSKRLWIRRLPSSSRTTLRSRELLSWSTSSSISSSTTCLASIKANTLIWGRWRRFLSEVPLWDTFIWVPTWLIAPCCRTLPVGRPWFKPASDEYYEWWLIETIYFNIDLGMQIFWGGKSLRTHGTFMSWSVAIRTCLFPWALCFGWSVFWPVRSLIDWLRLFRYQSGFD